MTKQDLTNPASLGDIVQNINSMDWFDLGGGTKFKLLRYNEINGDWVLYVNMQPGAEFAAHKHLSSGQYFVTKGELIYDVGSATAGTYGYEPIGSVHTMAHCKVETEMLFIGHGAVAFTDDVGGVRFILNHEFLRDISQNKVVADISNEAL